MLRRDVLAGLCSTALMGVAEAAPTATRAALTIDRFDGVGVGKRPALVLLYGSDGLTNVGRYQTAARALVGAGYTVFLPHYFEATGDQRANFREIDSKFATWRQSVQTAMNDIVGQPGIDAKRLGVIGFSLGGALALATSARDGRIKAVVNFFGYLPDELKQAKRIAPTLTLHGDADRVVPVENATRINALLRSLGVPSESHIYPGEGHGLSSGTLIDAGLRSTTFLAQYL